MFGSKVDFDDTKNMSLHHDLSSPALYGELSETSENKLI